MVLWNAFPHLSLVLLGGIIHHAHQPNTTFRDLGGAFLGKIVALPGKYVVTLSPYEKPGEDTELGNFV